MNPLSVVEKSSNGFTKYSNGIPSSSPYPTSHQSIVSPFLNSWGALSFLGWLNVQNWQVHIIVSSKKRMKQKINWKTQKFWDEAKNILREFLTKQKVNWVKRRIWLEKSSLWQMLSSFLFLVDWPSWIWKRNISIRDQTWLSTGIWCRKGPAIERWLENIFMDGGGIGHYSKPGALCRSEVYWNNIRELHWFFCCWTRMLHATVHRLWIEFCCTTKRKEVRWIYQFPIRKPVCVVLWQCTQFRMLNIMSKLVGITTRVCQNSRLAGKLDPSGPLRHVLLF